MIVELTRDDMLRLWRTRAGLEPLRTDCRVEAVDGTDADSVLEPMMRAWYLNLLDTADTRLLRTEDVSHEIVLTRCDEHEAVEGMVPEHVRPQPRRAVHAGGGRAPPCAGAESLHGSRPDAPFV